MTEDPRDERRQTPDDPEGGGEDEISLDELSEEAAEIFERSNRQQQDAPRPQSAAIDDLASEEREEDEIVLDELDPEAASYFEVSAVGGRDQAPDPPREPEFRQPEEEELYEVEAAPAARRQQASPPPPEPQAERTTYHAAAHHPEAGSDTDSIRRLHNVEVEVVATLGTTRMQIKDILGLHVGSVVELHRLVGEPIDVTLNGRLIARGEVVVVDEKFAIRVNEITSPDE